MKVKDYQQSKAATSLALTFPSPFGEGVGGRSGDRGEAILSLPTAYLAPVSYYVALAHADAAQVDQYEHYVKQTWRNRCRIAMPQGPQDLVIPVCAAPPHTPIKDIRLSDHGNWQHHHWSALQTAYGKSPFFEYYADDFYPFYHSRQHHFLIDFNLELHQLISGLIDLPTPLGLSDRFLDASFPVAPSFKPYYQVFAPRLGFLPKLSIMDLLCNLGPESILYLSCLENQGRGGEKNTLP